MAQTLTLIDLQFGTTNSVPEIPLDAELQSIALQQDGTYTVTFQPIATPLDQNPPPIVIEGCIKVHPTHRPK